MSYIITFAGVALVIIGMLAVGIGSRQIGEDQGKLMATTRPAN